MSDEQLPLSVFDSCVLDSGFVVLQGSSYWTDLFVRHFLFQAEHCIDGDDLLFFVRKKHIKGSPRYLPKYEVSQITACFFVICNLLQYYYFTINNVVQKFKVYNSITRKKIRPTELPDYSLSF